MTDNSTRVLAHGGGRYTITSALASPQDLPPGTYTPSYNQMLGYSIVTIPDLEPPSYRVYGHRDETIAKVLRTYAAVNRSLGVLFEGDKGIGKSSTTVELARQARDEFSLPVFLVNHNTPGLSDFLGTLGECVIVFDEFEKNFPRSGDDGDAQAQFLTLFDGTDATKRLYIVTVNEQNRLSPYFINRPGRFHYLINFDYPDIAAITDYMTTEARGASQAQVNDAVAFAFRARCNYDHLRAIVTELGIAGPQAKFSDLIADLNIRDTENINFDVTVKLADGTELVSYNESVDTFFCDEDDPESVSFDLPHNLIDIQSSVTVKFLGTEGEVDRRSGAIIFTKDKIKRVQGYFYSSNIRDHFNENTLAAGRIGSEDRNFIIDLDRAEGTEVERFMVRSLTLTPAKSDHRRFF